MATIIHNVEEACSYNMNDIEVDEYWNLGDIPELKIHSIHAYPAKFPAFIASKAIGLAKEFGVEVKIISDIFCGCGTVALEAKCNKVDFWGCDINPVATLITRAKTYSYNTDKLQAYFFLVADLFNRDSNIKPYYEANERIRYWFYEEQYNELYKLKNSIDVIPNGKYKVAFNCLFSAILKSTSKWLTKSIKPQVDPNKKFPKVWTAFEKQFKNFLRGIKEIPTSNSKIDIVTCSILTRKSLPLVDLIVTSPPYVTSYEYADLHQLSSLWLGYTEDYTSLRKGTMGSMYNNNSYRFDMESLNGTAKKIITDLNSNPGIEPAKIKSIARYYIDMQKATQQCYKMLKPNSMAFFVIGDTEYRGTQIHNSRQLVESLIQSGFKEVLVSKRKIINKLLTPYRDETGKFTNDKEKRKIYHEEFVVIGRNL